MDFDLDKRVEIRFAGTGGQGLILASVIFSQAIGLYENKYVVQSQSYGPESRGGASKSEVVISNNIIDFPKATEPDVLLTMSSESYEKYSQDIKKNGLIICDSTFIKKYNEQPGINLIKIPITQIANEEIGRSIVANIIALGLVCGITKLVSFENIKKTLLDKIPKGTDTINTLALELGFTKAADLI